MVTRVDSPKIPSTAPGPKAATPGGKAGEQTEIARDGLTLSKPSETPTLGTAYKIEGGKIYTTDTVKLDADPERVMAAIEGDWSKWWPRSAVAPVPCDVALPRPEENESRFLFRPLASRGAPPSAYVVRQFTPTAEPAGGGGGALMMVVPTKLAGDLTGDGRFEIRATPDGKTLLTAKWDGVKPTGFKAWGPMPEALTKAHLALEAQALENLGAWLQKNP